MKTVSIKCPNCGAGHTVTANAKMVHCEYCNQDFMIDDEVKRIYLVNAEQAGYEFEKGRRRAIQEVEQTKNRIVKPIRLTPLEKYVDGVCPYCGEGFAIAVNKKESVCKHCGVGFNVNVARHLHRAKLEERIRRPQEAIGHYSKAYDLDNSSIIAREGIIRCKGLLKNYAFIRVNVPRLFTKDETLEFRIGSMVHIKSNGKENVYDYAALSNLEYDKNSFSFDYSGEREFYMTGAPEYVVNFVLDAKKGIYPSFKDIR